MIIHISQCDHEAEPGRASQHEEETEEFTDNEKQIGTRVETMKRDKEGDDKADGDVPMSDNVGETGMEVGYPYPSVNLNSAESRQVLLQETRDLAIHHPSNEACSNMRRVVSFLWAEHDR